MQQAIRFNRDNSPEIIAAFRMDQLGILRRISDVRRDTTENYSGARPMP